MARLHTPRPSSRRADLIATLVLAALGALLMAAFVGVAVR